MIEEGDRRRKILEESKYFTLSEAEMREWLSLLEEEKQQ